MPSVLVAMEPLATRVLSISSSPETGAPSQALVGLAQVVGRHRASDDISPTVGAGCPSSRLQGRVCLSCSIIGPA